MTHPLDVSDEELVGRLTQIEDSFDGTKIERRYKRVAENRRGFRQFCADRFAGRALSGGG
jgi:hypothetical protein